MPIVGFFILCINVPDPVYTYFGVVDPLCAVLVYWIPCVWGWNGRVTSVGGTSMHYEPLLSSPNCFNLSTLWHVFRNALFVRVLP